ncbi:aminodeoxychorismate/anthranilate synthase component II [Kangiella japonica]|uniref:Aminodeoxychorismate/anthranilate synthase component II n=1 Tax=Kangiella japonica TaxID=647384 RepID=A0ABN0ST77_9GAMM
MKILLIDNYDSFIYNLKYELELGGNEVVVCRNDIEYSELASFATSSDAIVLSPGPGAPSDAGHCLKLVGELAPTLPILGVCLGHQVIVEAFGGRVGKAKSIVHGKACVVESNQTGLLKGLEARLTVARYHSLAAQQLSADLRIDAVSHDGEVMAVSHNQYPIYGLQFHPESIMTKAGNKILSNFVQLAKEFRAQGERHVEFA